LTDVVEGSAANRGYMLFKLKAGIKDYPEIARELRGAECKILKVNRGAGYFSALVAEANQEIFSFGRVNGEAVSTESGIDLVKYSGEGG